MSSIPLGARGALLRRLSHRPPVCSSSSSPPSSSPVTRRSVSIAALFLSTFPSRAASAGSPFDKYVKRKKLEPLETYVPAVLLTQDQFKDLEKYLEMEQPKYDISRSLLRSGPAASLRVNIRAVAQYADDDGKGKLASNAVDQCLRALEDLDSLFLHASRNDPTASVESMKSKINIALGALDSLLETVPSELLDKGRAIAEAYRSPIDQNNESKSEDPDPELKQLEALL
ncbi:hypothetical protein J5N97_006825 [Dioscorea zingiberensis]|uniref:DUF7880 domain-containing protein n=1 Tax=Dioscorea zingiberensis TaxID=325984 RepID=A0A9D5DBI5_9LILI|nr:hypothetical protein J5N97_006825 [Dioscorea zingiberensis]